MKYKTVIFVIFCIFFSFCFHTYADEAKSNDSAITLAENIAPAEEVPFLNTEDNSPEFKSNFMQSVGILSILTGIMIASIFFFKRIKSKSGNFSETLNISSNCYIGNNKRISILEADSQRFLIGITSSQITLISELPPQENIENIKRENTGSKGQSFRKYFENIVSPSSGKKFISRIMTATAKQNTNLRKSDSVKC